MDYYQIKNGKGMWRIGHNPLPFEVNGWAGGEGTSPI